MSRAKAPAKTRAQSRRAPNRSRPARTGPFLTGNNLRVVLCVLLAGTTIALDSPVIKYPFIVLDDHDYVTANPHVHNGLSWSTVKWAFTSFAAANWHPLTWLLLLSEERGAVYKIEYSSVARISPAIKGIRLS